VHPRNDTRIFIKEAQTLASYLPCNVWLLVADGNGNLYERKKRVSIYDIGCLNGGRINRALTGSLRVLFAIHRLKPEIVHFHDPELIPLGLFLKLLGYKVIYDVHEDVPSQVLSKHYLPGIIRKPLARITALIECIGAKAFKAVVPTTLGIAGRFPEKKTVTVHNYPIITELSQSSPVQYIDRPKSFAYVGLIAQSRGTEEVVEAFGLLHKTHNARFDLAGTFVPDSLLDTMQKLSGWESVNYHGEISRDEVAKLLGSVRAGIVTHHPIPNEIVALPIKLFEYMSVGLPVIASNFPNMRRIVEDAECGLLVDPLNPEKIAEAMGWILDHPDEAKIMGQNGRQAIERKYNWDAEAHKIISLYEKILSS
jgi:glycosyltransferase involved in cell wall biosynthesis